MSQGEDAGSSSEQRNGSGKMRLLLGRIASVLGILVGLTVVFIPNSALMTFILAAVLGGTGYVLGARRLGVAAIVVAVVALILGAMAVSGYIPGIDPPGVNEQSPD